MDLAAQLRSLHQPGDPLVLVNAWDVASAEHVAAAGARAIGTSSAAIAASLGVPDDPSAPVDVMLDAIARIARSVEVPVTADVLNGYGLDPGELVDRLLATGAVGCNLEDSDPGGLRAPDVVAAQLADVRSAAGPSLVINARIDAYLHGGSTADVLDRARSYLEAGADCVYPVSLTDPATIRELVDALAAPVNTNLPNAAALPAIVAAGASRISIGPMAFRRALGALDQLAAELLPR